MCGQREEGNLRDTERGGSGIDRLSYGSRRDSKGSPRVGEEASKRKGKKKKKKRSRYTFSPLQLLTCSRRNITIIVTSNLYVKTHCFSICLSTFFGDSCSLPLPVMVIFLIWARIEESDYCCDKI